MVDTECNHSRYKNKNHKFIHHSEQQNHRLSHKQGLSNEPANTPIAQKIKQLETTLAFFDKKTEFFFVCCHFL
jgi:hypothetical protein